MKAEDIKNIACVGAGVIGAGWATNFAMKGYSVAVFDISPESLKKAESIIEKNLQYLADKDLIKKEDIKAIKNKVKYTTDLKEAVEDAQFIQESGPERYDIKEQMLKEIEKYTSKETIIASSTSGLLISEIAKNAVYPERCIGGHPYNPPHLIPLVEITKGEKSSDEAAKTAYDFYAALNKEPVILQKETVGFIANRLQLALYREAIDLVVRGVCTVEDVDKATLYGPGLRLGVMGPNLIFHLGAGEQGIRGLLTSLHDSSAARLKDMANWVEEPEGWPDIAEEGVLKEIENRPQETGKTIPELIKFRDDMLIELLKLHKKI
ncbi:3-hydroxyacyl-CoA dehydrogenase family protein [Clostridium sp. SYSU_GA19001]|uniref:3-hydroxyacyl-CoA dehydrogenase family protein n=1 Tax=Clostridium caldaquaticum TaxID=2940653 RepID=UPI0020778F4E|nr:3-hydroxyacyl-CoA dehydrogenase family protein [Clostridium caldaquaticum]MCM8711243.1 3-hydroxyacyl-CoA dehydrogenase family protein [Clostridium caldaquaticum]